MNFDIGAHTIFLGLAGSRAHGTDSVDSDVDVRGVCIPPISVRNSLFTSFEQHEGDLPDLLAHALWAHIHSRAPNVRPGATKQESVIFNLSKFLRLCEAANPNALEILFTDRADWVWALEPWHLLHGERTRFLTLKVKETFLGYALAQLKRIRTHRSWLLDPPKAPPQRTDFGLPANEGTLSADLRNRLEAALSKRAREYSLDDVEMPPDVRFTLSERLEALLSDLLAVEPAELSERTRALASHSLALPSDLMQTLNAEKRYQGAMQHWTAYQAWRAHRNRARADLEAEHGYDTKHAMHLVRLMRMGLEVLKHGELRVRRDDAPELRSIRAGALSFSALESLANELQSEIAAAARQANLPKAVDRDWLEGLNLELLATAT